MDEWFLLKLNRTIHALYRMVMLPMTLGTPNPQTAPISTFCIAFRIFLVGELRDFEFGIQVDRS